MHRPAAIRSSSSARAVGVAAASLLAMCALLSLSSSGNALELIVHLPESGRRIGHVAVRLHGETPRDEVLYDFGRYGRVWGRLRLSGDGTLRVWRGQRAVRRYLRHGTRFRRAIGFEIGATPDELARVRAWYESLLRTAVWQRRYGPYTVYLLPQNYDGVTTQCSAVAQAGLKAIWPQDRFSRLLPPRFNLARGFNTQEKVFYFGRQRSLGQDAVMLPLDVVAALEHAVAREKGLVRAVRHYRGTGLARYRRRHTASEGRSTRRRTGGPESQGAVKRAAGQKQR